MSRPHLTLSNKKFLVIRQTSTAANKKCRQWDVRLVLPIDGIFVERCICSLLIRNWVVVLIKVVIREFSECCEFSVFANQSALPKFLKLFKFPRY